jgi:hypothetical protein
MDAVNFYLRNGMGWTAKAFIKHHDKRYGERAKCEFCQPEYLHAMEEFHKLDSSGLFTYQDLPVKQNVGTNGMGIPCLPTPFGLMVPIESLPPDVKNEVLRRINESRGGTE